MFILLQEEDKKAVQVNLSKFGFVCWVLIYRKITTKIYKQPTLKAPYFNMSVSVYVQQTAYMYTSVNAVIGLLAFRT